MYQTVAALLKLQDNNPNQNPKITIEQYQRWKKKLVFDRLQGLRTGQSFCNEFDITDNIVFYESVAGDRLFKYIEETYVQ